MGGKDDTFDSSTYVIKATDTSLLELERASQEEKQYYIDKAKAYVMTEVINHLQSPLSEDELSSLFRDKYYEAKSFGNEELFAKRIEALRALQFEAVLNKNKY